MNKKIRNISVIAIVLILIIVFAGQSNNKEGYTVGAVLPLTGFGAYWGEPIQNAMLLAEQDINNGGEYEIDLIIEDGQSNLSSSVSAAQKLINVDKADLIYSEFSSISSAISPVVSESGIPFFYSAFNKDIVESNDLSVKTFITYDVVCEWYKDNIIDSPDHKVVILSQITGAVPGCIDELSEKISEDNVLVLENLPQDNDFRTILLQINRFDPDYIFHMTYESTSLAFIKQEKELGVSFNSFCYKLDCMTEKIIDEIGLDKLEGSVYFEIDISDEFVDRYSQLYSVSSIDDFEPAAMSYQYLLSIAEAAGECGEDDACFIGYFDDLDLGSDGPIAGYYEDGIFRPNLKYVTIQGGEKVDY